MKQIIQLLVALTMLGGCAVMVPGHLYPVQGSLASAAPPAIFNVTFSSVLNSGTLSATLQGGETCTGRPAPVPQNDPSVSASSADWDRIYGEGFFVANILGNHDLNRAVLAGNKGTTLNVEFVGGAGNMAHAKGIATDNKGNIFKLTF